MSFRGLAPILAYRPVMTEILNHTAEPVRHVPVLPAETLLMPFLRTLGAGIWMEPWGWAATPRLCLALPPISNCAGLTGDEDAMALAKQRLAVFGNRAHFFTAITVILLARWQSLAGTG